jgi:hypothetical protein
MSSETLPCCCGSQCCPCNPLYGGRTSWKMNWSGRISISPQTDCLCLCSQGEIFPIVNLTTYEATKRSAVFTWDNSFDPLSSNFCSMNLYMDSDAISPQIVVIDYQCETNGGCGVRPGASRFVLPSRIKVKMNLFPPRNSGPGCSDSSPLPWRAHVYCGAGFSASAASFRFTGSFSCIDPNPFVFEPSLSSVGGIPMTTSTLINTCGGVIGYSIISGSAGILSVT